MLAFSFLHSGLSWPPGLASSLLYLLFLCFTCNHFQVRSSLVCIPENLTSTKALEGSHRPFLLTPWSTDFHGHGQWLQRPLISLLFRTETYKDDRKIQRQLYMTAHPCSALGGLC